ncbi:MAG: hypothetical protein V4663_14575 [Bacteroidota bacterium]
MNKPSQNAQTNPVASQHYIGQTILFLSDVMYKVGLPGFIVIIISVCVITFSSPNQKEAIIERWILFNNNTQLQTLTILVIVLSVIIYITMAYFFSKVHRLDRDEIKRLSAEKKELQEKLIGRNLKSSGDK